MNKNRETNEASAVKRLSLFSLIYVYRKWILIGKCKIMMESLFLTRHISIVSKLTTAFCLVSCLLKDFLVALISGYDLGYSIGYKARYNNSSLAIKALHSCTVGFEFNVDSIRVQTCSQLWCQHADIYWIYCTAQADGNVFCWAVFCSEARERDTLKFNPDTRWYMRVITGLLQFLLRGVWCYVVVFPT